MLANNYVGKNKLDIIFLTVYKMCVCVGVGIGLGDVPGVCLFRYEIYI